MTDPNNQPSAPAGGAADPAKGGAAPPAPPTAPASPPGGGAPPASAADWRAGLAPELRDDPTLKRYTDVSALARGLVEANKLIGRTGVRVPQEGDGPEIVAAWRKAMGIPETAEGYEIKPPEGFPAERWDGEFEKEFRGVAHELGVPAKAAQRLVELYASKQAAQLEKIKAARAATETNLRKDWGAEYDVRQAAADQAIEGYARKAGFTDEDFALLASVGLGEKMMRVMAEFGAEGLPSRGPGAGAGSIAGMTADQIEKEMDELRAKPGFYDKLHPDNVTLMTRYKALQEARG